MKKPPSLNRKAPLARLYDAIAVVMVVLLPLSLTLVLWDRENNRVKREAEIEFGFRVREATEALQARMLAFGQVLRGTAGVFAVTDRLTSDDWQKYVRQLEVSKSYPGIAAIAFAPIVAADRLNEFVSRIRKSDQSRYEVWPRGDRPMLAPTLYNEPFTDRNLRALGFDIYSDSTRVAALEMARDTGEATLSARITLAQDAGDASRPGISMFVPIYRRGTVTTTVTQRRKALAGFVSGEFRMDELLNDLFGERPGLELRIYDGKPDPAASPLAQQFPRSETRSSTPQFTAQQRLVLANRIWTLQFASTPDFERAMDNGRSGLVLGGGLFMSVLLIAFIWSIANTRDHAVRLARQMTVDLNNSRDALSTSEERLSLALQGSGLAMFDWDVPTGAVQLSEQWAMMLGDTPGETVTTIAELSRLAHPEDMPRLRQELQAASSGKSDFYRVEHRVKNLRGEWIWIFSRAKVVERNAEGAALRVTGTNADISERKRIEKMKDEFIGTVSHELRTPLTAILGALGLLCGKDAPDGQNARMLLDMAYQNSERLAALVNDVLDTEKLEAGMMEMRMAPTAVGPFLQRAMELHRSYADRYNVHCELRSPLPGVSVQTDPERLMQVVTNLLSNATKFSPAGGTVTISADVQGDRVRISVADEGPGIPAEFRDRVFKKFAQADASSTRQKGGTGLGLWICQAIIEKLGGRIGYESEPGKGATFYFELPLGARTSPIDGASSCSDT